MEMTKLQEFSDNDLLNEFSRRFDDFVMCARKTGYGGKEKVHERRYYHGDRHACAGMAFAVAQVCIHDQWGINADVIQY